MNLKLLAYEGTPLLESSYRCDVLTSYTWWLMNILTHPEHIDSAVFQAAKRHGAIASKAYLRDTFGDTVTGCHLPCCLDVRIDRTGVQNSACRLYTRSVLHSSYRISLNLMASRCASKRKRATSGDGES